MSAQRRKASEAAKALRVYDDDYLLCRRGNLGHVWVVVGFYKGGTGVTVREVECARCGSARHDRWSADGAERIGSAYRYSEGYVIEQGEAHFTVATSDVRREVIRRATVYANADAMLASLTRGRNGNR